jgi:hypothetical protein
MNSRVAIRHMHGLCSNNTSTMKASTQVVQHGRDESRGCCSTWASIGQTGVLALQHGRFLDEAIAVPMHMRLPIQHQCFRGARHAHSPCNNSERGVQADCQGCHVRTCACRETWPNTNGFLPMQVAAGCLQPMCPCRCSSLLAGKKQSSLHDAARSPIYGQETQVHHQHSQHEGLTTCWGTTLVRSQAANPVLIIR